MKSKKAMYKCANWLLYCIKIGWDKKDLDGLEILWWQYHDEQTGLLK